MEILLEKPNGTKVTKDDKGNCRVSWIGRYDFDGFVEKVEYAETFKTDNYQYSSGCICNHTFPYKCRDDKTPEQRALDFAKGL